MVDATKQTMSRPGRRKFELRGGCLGGAADGFPRVANAPEAFIKRTHIRYMYLTNDLKKVVKQDSFSCQVNWLVNDVIMEPLHGKEIYLCAAPMLEKKNYENECK